MKKTHKKSYGYSAISIKSDVAVRFRRYSKQFARPNSEVLQRMLIFLQRNGLNPFDNNIKKIVSEIQRNRKLIEYLISIVKDIEIKQTRPTYEMVKILFEAHSRTKKDVKQEILILPQTESEELKETVPKEYHERLHQEFSEYKRDCRRLLEKVIVVKPNFGKPYLKVELSPREYEKLRRRLNRDRSCT